MANEQDVEQIALSLPETTKDPDGFSFSVRKKGIAWSYMERVASDRPRVRRSDVLAVRVVDEDEKEIMIAANPDAFFTTDHYNEYPAALVNLPAIDIDELEDFLTSAWRTRAPRRLIEEFDVRNGYIRRRGCQLLYAADYGWKEYGLRCIHCLRARLIGHRDTANWICLKNVQFILRLSTWATMPSCGTA